MYYDGEDTQELRVTDDAVGHHGRGEFQIAFVVVGHGGCRRRRLRVRRRVRRRMAVRGVPFAVLPVVVMVVMFVVFVVSLVVVRVVVVFVVTVVIVVRRLVAAALAVQRRHLARRRQPACPDFRVLVRRPRPRPRDDRLTVGIVHHLRGPHVCRRRRRHHGRGPDFTPERVEGKVFPRVRGHHLKKQM